LDTEQLIRDVVKNVIEKLMNENAFRAEPTTSGAAATGLQPPRADANQGRKVVVGYQFGTYIFASRILILCLGRGTR